MADEHVTDPLDESRSSEIASTRASPWKATRLVPIVFALALLAVPCLPFVAIGVDVYRSNRERQRLLHETDHQALLVASRELMREYSGQHFADPAHDPRVPPIIRELGPSYMDIAAEELHVELHGGFDHYGFNAFASDSNPDDGSLKLIDGLFYYTE